VTFALLSGAFAAGEEFAEPAVSGAVHRISERLKSVGGDEPHADEELEIQFLGLAMRTHHAGKAIAVGNSNSRKTKLCCLLNQLFRMAGAAQEREIGGDGELNVFAHAYTPCTNHLASAPYEPSR
jgi:hypothetical protein